MGLIATIGGWHFTLLGFVIPISLGGLFLASIGLPSSSPSDEHEISIVLYLESFKGVISDRSALACLVGNVLRMAAFMAIMIYRVSFFRQGFSVSIDFVSVIVIGASLCYTLDSLVAGRLVDIFGRKSITVVTAFLAGLLTISFVCVPNLWLSLACLSLLALVF